MSAMLEAGAAPDRPHRLSVPGYEALAARLIGAARAGRLGQSCLVAGPPGTGRTAMAQLLAQALLCTDPSRGERPCGHCRACRLVAQKTHPDLHWLEAPLRVEAARELLRMLSLAPSESERRLAVVPEVDLATASAANCMLKTLEEPPTHAGLILTAGDLDATLPTIRSRCIVVSMRALPIASASEILRLECDASDEEAALLARLSGGRLGWARLAREDDSVLGARRQWLGALAAALTADVAGRLGLAGELARDSAELATGLAVWISWWRDVLLVRLGVEEPVVNRDVLPELRDAAGRYDVGDITRVLRGLEDALRRLAANAQPQLALEVMLLELPS